MSNYVQNNKLFFSSETLRKKRKSGGNGECKQLNQGGGGNAKRNLKVQKFLANHDRDIHITSTFKEENVQSKGRQL